jgi:plasmid stabilization system protein ParE
VLPLRWTERAVAHLESIVDYISLTSPIYAESMIGRIEQRLHLARANPQLGKTAVEADDLHVRELVVPPYRVFYRVRPDCVEVLAVVHARQDLTNAL